jgi:hypothetical protein
MLRFIAKMLGEELQLGDPLSSRDVHVFQGPRSMSRALGSLTNCTRANAANIAFARQPVRPRRRAKWQPSPCKGR